MKATTKDLRLHTNAVLAAVDRGETVVITYRGKCRAVLQRWAGERPVSDRNPAFGIWADHMDEDVPRQVRQMRQPRALT